MAIEAERRDYIRRLEKGRLSAGWRLEPMPEYAENKHIKRWWSSAQDDVIRQLIAEFDWGWHQEALSPLLESINGDELERWRNTDPLCERHAYANVLLYFAAARALTLGLEKGLVVPEPAACAVCAETFDERSVKAKWRSQLGSDVCAVCLTKALVLDGVPDSSRKEALEFVNQLVDTLERIPPQQLPDPVAELAHLERDQLITVIKLLIRRPTVSRVRELFGSWLQALVAADVLNGDVHRTSRGTRCVAEDGHVCFSLGEKTIDDLMHRLGISHAKEVAYPEGGMRADFMVGDALVEYFGLHGNPQYDEKSARKREMCADHDVELIEVFPADLLDVPRLEARLKALVP